jgi:hypothetical protein
MFMFIHTVYQLKHGIKITYFMMICTKHFRRPGKLKEHHPLHDNSHPHTANLMTVMLVSMGWVIMNHPPHSPDLAPSDFHLF